MRPFIQFSSRNIQKSNEYYLAFHIDEDCFAANFPMVAGFSKEYRFEKYLGNVPFISGIVNFNNENIPIIDLKTKMGMIAKPLENTGRIVIIETEMYSTKLKFGMFYDILGDAFEIPEKSIMVAPNIDKYLNSGCIKGIHVHEKNSIMIVDFERILSVDDLIDIMVIYGKRIKR